MCPKLNNQICTLVELGPAHLDCVSEVFCLGDEWWPNCSVYISQFFFDKYDNYIA